MKVIGKYWDERSPEFDRGHDTEDIKVWEGTLKELLGDDFHKNVVDLGTGTGFLANMTARIGYPTVGVDLSREMMKYAVRHGRKNNSGALFMEGSALELPFMENSTDYIINARLLWTLIEPEEAFAEWRRVLRPGGKLLSFHRMQEGGGITIQNLNFYGDEETDGSLKMIRAKMEDLIRLMKKTGFEDVELRKLPGLTRPEFDYESWFVLMGTKPVTRRQREEEGMADFWDASAAAYDAAHEVAHKEIWKQRLFELIGGEKEKSILDVATGTGLIANMLGAMGYAEVIGIDVSEKMMQIAQEGRKAQNLEQVSYQYANALDLPFGDDRFDVVISSRFLWTLTEPLNALEEWKRVLKKGGRLIAINEVDEQNASKEEEPGGYQEQTGAEELPCRFLKREEMKHLFQQAGFSEVEALPMPGCHLENSKKENWVAFVGTFKK